jgi:hypothetical protein
VPRACRALLAVLLLPTLLAVAPTTAARADPPRASTQARDGLAARIDRLPGVVAVQERRSDVNGYRLFVVRFRQPVDHARPGGATFEQRVVVLHRSVDRPTVLVTEGYGVSTSPYGPSEPAALLAGNQVAVEHRFFSPSRPPSPHWARQLTIRQAAADLHRVVTSFRGLYQRRWISTGASKSGMTATYFRRFYPGDVSATVAYVAPNDVVDADDSYNAFLDHVGTRACRDALVAVQRRTLGDDRAWFRERTRRAAAEAGWTWRVVGSFEKAWEAAVVDVYFAFWQYQPVSECGSVPGPSSSRKDVWGWYERVSPLTVYADQKLRRYVPYYYQAASQIGSPEPYETRIGDLLRHPGADVAATFVPAALKPVAHDAAAMPDVDRWVRQRSHRMIFVYGGNDPWSAEPFTCGADGAGRDCHRYVVAGGTHGSQIGDLPARKRRAAVARLERWAGLR